MSLPLDESVDSYTITFRREIVFYLRQLINDKDQVSISFNEGNDTLLTILLDVDDEEGLLYFDWGSSEETNKRFLQSDRNFFVAMPGGVRNQFLCGQPRATTQGGRPAFAVKLPEKYVRMQRREFFRLVLPMTQRPACFITHEGKTMELSTVDIGIGGVGLETQELLFPCDLGTEFADVRIEFKGFGELRAPLAVRYAGDITKGTKQVKRLGCHFLKLSAAQENLVQKFMANIQREERAKLG
jgi:c-di-GMP-binding flagellar brake protein YcgR